MARPGPIGDRPANPQFRSTPPHRSIAGRPPDSTARSGDPDPFRARCAQGAGYQDASDQKQAEHLDAPRAVATMAARPGTFKIGCHALGRLLAIGELE